MAMTSRLVPADIEDVWNVLANGFTYSAWVVGTSQIRSVDRDFPAPGTALHYRVGLGALAKDDATRVVSCDPPRTLELEAQAWPLGTAGIRIELTPSGGPGGAATHVTLTETPARGLGRALHNPLTDVLLHQRNVETLRRLEKVCTGSL